VCVARESASGPPGGRPAHLPGATARPGRASTPSLTSENWASDLAPQEGRHHRGRSGVPCAAKQWRGFSPSQDGREDCVQGAAGVAGGHRRARGAAAATVGAITAQSGGRAPTEAAAIDLRHGQLHREDEDQQDGRGRRARLSAPVGAIYHRIIVPELCLYDLFGKEGFFVCSMIVIICIIPS